MFPFLYSVEQNNIENRLRIENIELEFNRNTLVEIPNSQELHQYSGDNQNSRNSTRHFKTDQGKWKNV